MANERVSQLNEIVAAELASNDLFFITDTSARESKKMQADQLLLFIESSGSFNAYHSTTSDTASFVAGNNVFGSVSSASFASTTFSASVSNQSQTSVTASYALSASAISPVVSAFTASYLNYTGGNTGTASFSITASNATNATNAKFLVFTGVSNGTASYALNSGNTISASYVLSSSYAITSSFSTTSSFTLSSSFSTNALTASSLNTSISPGLALAFGLITGSSNNAANFNLALNYNISSVKFLGVVNSNNAYAITFTNPLPSTNYFLIGTGHEDGPAEPLTSYLNIRHTKTTSFCTMSLWYGGDASAGELFNIGFTIFGV